MSDLEFHINSEQCAYVERLNYEVKGLRTLNCQLIRLNCEGEACEQFREQLKEKTAEYHFAINELARLLVPELEWGFIRSVSVDFMTSVLRVTMEGDK